jgi:hypothetical protein
MPGSPEGINIYYKEHWMYGQAGRSAVVGG